MKLNIEELAREAGAGYGAITEEIMERFARLIVERCARLCDRLSNDWHGHDGKYALEDAANKIREHNQTITPSDAS